MPEEFAEGLEQQLATQVPNTPANQPVDAFTDFRSRITGLAENITNDELVDHILSLQEKAAKAEAFELQNQQFLAQQAQVVADASKTPVPNQPAATTEDEFALPWNLTRIDPQLEMLCDIDAKTGQYIPLNAMSPAHIAAAESLNKHAREARKFVQEYTSDPRGVTELLTKRQIAALKKELREEFEAYKAEFEPIKQHVATSKAEQETQEFCKNHPELFLEGGNTLSPLGVEVEFTMEKYGVTAAQALADVEAKMARLAPPAAPVQPTPKVSISKVQPNSAAPNGQRFIDRISPQSREMASKPEHEGNPKKTMTMADMRKEYGISQN